MHVKISGRMLGESFVALMLLAGSLLGQMTAQTPLQTPAATPPLAAPPAQPAQPQPPPAPAHASFPSRDSLADYVQRMSAGEKTPTHTSIGSLWDDHGAMANMVADYKARRVGDLVTISVAQNLSATSSGNVATNRSYTASSGITALPGQLKTGGIANLFSPTSSQVLSGKAQATSQTSLTTTLTGRVAAVLNTGVLVVEAERQIVMNNERENVVLRGLVRPGDLDATNTVASNNVGSLEIEVKGKGVISDGVHQPNAVIRWILKLVGF